MGGDEAWVWESTDQTMRALVSVQSLWPSPGGEEPPKAFMQEWDTIIVVFLSDRFGRPDFFKPKHWEYQTLAWQGEQQNILGDFKQT